MKDYAQKHPARKKRQNSGNHKNRPARSSVVFFIVFFTLLLLFLFLAKSHRTAHQQKKEVFSITFPLSAKPLIQHLPSAKATSIHHNENGNYAFYTLLPQMAVSVPKQTMPADTHLLPSTRYLLQTAALAHYQEANQLRDQLVSMGYPAYIQTPSTNQHWYLVLLGPYTDINQAKEDQERLYQNEHLDSLLLQHLQSPQQPNQTRQPITKEQM